MLKNSFLANAFDKRSLVSAAIITLLVLTIPLTAMQFTTEVNWDLLDFMVMGSLIFCVINLYLYFSKRLHKKYKVPIALTCAFLFILVWVELAVGVFTNLGS